MQLPFRSLPEHAVSFPLRSRAGPHRRLPRYMAKRPSLTIVIPTLIERIGKEDKRAEEVSCFSPFTPESSRSEAESCTGGEDECTADEDQPDPTVVVDVDPQTMLKRRVEPEEQQHHQPPRSVPRFGTRWSRRLQQSCLQPIFHLAVQGTSTPTTPSRPRRLATLSVIPCSQNLCDENLPPSSLPDNPLLSYSRRASNPFDYRSSHRLPKIPTPPPPARDLKSRPNLDCRQPLHRLHLPSHRLDPHISTPKTLAAP